MISLSYQNRIRLLTVSVILLVTSCASTEQAADTDPQELQQPERPIPYPLDIPVNFLAAMNEGSRTATGEPGSSYWQNEASYQLKAELIPDDHLLIGQAHIEYSNHSPDDLQQIILELNQNLHKGGTMKKENTEITGGVELLQLRVRGDDVDELSDDSGYYQREQGYLIDATRMLIVLDEALASGETIDLEVRWTFEVPQRGAGGRMGHSQENLFFLGYWYPQMAVYDDVYGWFTDPFLGNAEFYHPFADYELEISVPDNWLVMATGDFLNPDEVLADHIHERYVQAGTSDEIVQIVRQSDLGAATRISDNGTLTWRFEADRVRDVAFSVTRESMWDGARTTVGDLNGDGENNYTRINSFYRQTAPLWTDQAEYSQHSISFLSDYLDHPYPWPHMTSIEGADIIGGGMEYPMMTIIGSYNNVGAQQLHSVTAHEFAHMWLPMIVNSNERRYTWMDEGFTTFNTHQAMVDRYPEDFDNPSVFESYLQIAGTDLEGPIMRWSDYHYPGPAYGIASYPKPASVLTALKGLLGEEMFMEAYHTFIEEWAYRNPYPWDFFNTMERIANTDLDWFWRSWYHETWTLDQAVGEVDDQTDQIIVEIEDLGEVPMPVHLLLVLEDGSELTAEIPVDTWLNGTRSASVTLDTGQPVAEIIIDPDYNFPDVDRSNNHWEMSQ